MACNDCGKTEEGCGCQQEALSISQVCNPVVCAVEECSETFNAGCILYADADIICNEVVLVTEGDTMAQALANVSAYFCSTEMVEAEILCGVDVVVPAETSLEDAIPLVVAYFCTAIDNIVELTSVTVSTADTPVGAEGCITRAYTINFLSDAVTIDTIVFTSPVICPPAAIQIFIDNSISSIPAVVVSQTICSVPSLYPGGSPVDNIVVATDSTIQEAFNSVTAYYCGRIADLNAEIFKRRGLFTATADATIANTSTNLTLVGTGLGSMTVPQDGFFVGDTFKLRVTGTRQMGLATTHDFEIKIGLIVIGTFALGSIGAINSWAIEADITIRTIGATGTVQLGATFLADTGQNAITQNTVIDTTLVAGSLFDVRGSFGVADAGNILTSKTVSLTKLY